MGDLVLEKTHRKISDVTISDMIILFLVLHLFRQLDLGLLKLMKIIHGHSWALINAGWIFSAGVIFQRGACTHL